MASNLLSMERQVPWKIGKHLMPILIIGMLIAYMDRINVGLASLQMNKALNISPAAYGLGAGLFFLAYFVFEIPSNLISEKVGPRKSLARIMITWGIVAVGMGFIQGLRSFYTMRILLGIAEAGFFQGLCYI